MTSGGQRVLVLFETGNPGHGRKTLSELPPDPDAETQEERTARQLRMVRRLTELGMQLAEAAAAKAARDLAEEAPDTPKPKGPDPALSFARYCTVVRQCIALETRILAGPAQPGGRRKPPYDVRRNLLKRVFTEGTQRHHDGKEAARTLIEAGEEALAADPEGRKQIYDIVWDACKTTGITIDKGTLHDEMLFMVEIWDVPIDKHPLLKPVPAWLIPHRPKGPGPPP